MSTHAHDLLDNIKIILKVVLLLGVLHVISISELSGGRYKHVCMMG